jgi:hypothetical protein
VSSPEREGARELLRRLGATPVGTRIVLAGSSGLFTASESLPALTEDLDFLVDSEWLAQHEGDVLDAMAQLGFRHEAGTSTFTQPAGHSLDLVGYSLTGAPIDRIGGGSVIRVMVYADLGQIVARPGTVIDVPGGGRALSPAALAATKLLTVRLEKGGKDKLQALLLIDEHAEDQRFAAELTAVLGGFEADRLLDALADAQASVLVLSADPLRADPQSAGYARLHDAAARGLRTLMSWVRP